MNYAEANAKLVGRCKDSRKLANNTYLKRRDENIAIRLHSTDVITLFPDGSIRLNSDGWVTPTTVKRMHRYLPFSVWRERREIFISVNDTKYAFADGLTMRPISGTLQYTVEGAGNLESIYAEWRDIDREKARVRYWVNKAAGKRDKSACNGGWCKCHKRRLNYDCGCGCVLVPSSSSRLTANDVMQESNYRVQAAKADIFGRMRLANEVGQIIETDAEYELIHLSLQGSFQTAYYLRFRADGTLAPVESTTIKQAIFEALTAGFQKVPPAKTISKKAYAA